MLVLRVICGVRYQIEGTENIPKDKPFVVLSNHQSQWETYCLAYVFKPISFVLKQELLSIPVFGWCIAKMKPIAIDRKNPRKALKDIQSKGLSRLQDDQLPVLVFPEGTRQSPTEVGKFARSGAQLAVNANVDLLYVAHNSGHCWIPGKLMKKPGVITVSISKAQTIADKSSTEITKEAEAWVRQKLAAF